MKRTDNLKNQQAKITVTFYSERGKDAVRQLKKKYVVKNWRNEDDLRRLLDEIAHEMNYISGYGIGEIAVTAKGLKFKVDFSEKYVPYKEKMDLWEALYFKVGWRNAWRDRSVWIVLPRVNIFESMKTPKTPYNSQQQLLQIKRNIDDVIKVDHDNPLWSSFLHKIYAGKTLFPDTKYEWEHLLPKEGKKFVAYGISYLPKTQTSIHQFQKKRKKEKERKQKAEREQKRQERLGIVYKDKKRKKKADQVYIVQQREEHGTNNLYKIGISNAPKKRLQALKTSNPHELKIVHTFVAESAKEAETQLHAYFEHINVKGEWFQLKPEHVAELKQIKEFKNGQFIKADSSCSA